MIRALGVVFALAALPALADEAPRVVSLGGSVSEIVVALGAGDDLVARDTTSTYPESLTALPDVGYVRALSPEGVLSVKPSLILAEDGAGPPEAIEVLKAAGVAFHSIPGTPSPEGVAEKITAVAAALNVPDRGATLAAKVTRDFAEVRALTAGVTTPRRVLFILSLKGGRIMAAGAGTEAEGIISLAGGINAATGFDGYKPMTDEAVLIAAPDVILMMDREGDLAIADAEVMAHPALAATPAAGAGAIIRMDGMLLLGFGLRTPEAMHTLHAALYPKG